MNNPEIDIQEIDVIMETIGTDAEHVIAILQAIQKRYHYVPQPALERICEITDVTPSAITGTETRLAIRRTA